MLSDQDIVDLICEGSDESREIIYKNFEHVFEIYMKKYSKLFYQNTIDLQDAKSECLFAFNEAISCFDLEKKSSFITFLSMCIERRLLKIIRNASTIKNKLHSNAYSLDYVYKDSGLVFSDTLEEFESDPMVILENLESEKNIQRKIKEELSSLEFTVYKLMLDNYDCEKISLYLEKDLKQVYNAINRVKTKVKEIIDNEKTGVEN